MPQLSRDDRTERGVVVVKWDSLGLAIREIRGVTGHDPVSSRLVGIVSMAMAAQDGELVDDL